MVWRKWLWRIFLLIVPNWEVQGDYGGIQSSKIQTNFSHIRSVILKLPTRIMLSRQTVNTSFPKKYQKYFTGPPRKEKKVPTKKFSHKNLLKGQIQIFRRFYHFIIIRTINLLFWWNPYSNWFKFILETWIFM